MKSIILTAFTLAGAYKLPCTPLRSSSSSSSMAPFSSRRPAPMTMYFDDITHSNPIPTNPSTSTSKFPAHSFADPATASQIPDSDIIGHLSSWTDNTIIRTALDNLGPSTSATPPQLQYSVVRDERPLACLAEFWSCLNRVIDTSTDESSVTMVAFPSSPALQDYDVFSLLDKAIDFSAPSCVHFGKRIQLTHYHPSFKRAPRLVYFGRHSPFPVLGLTVKSIEQEQSVLDLDDADIPMYNAKKKVNSVDMMIYFNEGITPVPAPELPAHDPPTSFEDITTPKISRTSLAMLYNRAAAPSTVDSTLPNPRVRNAEKHCSEDDEFIEQCKEWIAQVKSRQGKNGGSAPKVKSSHNRMGEMGFQAKQPKEDAKVAAEYINPLEHIDSVNKWTLSQHERPEKVYEDVWKAISDLEEAGIAKDLEAAAAKASSPRKKFEHIAWMESLGNPQQKKTAVISTMFVTPFYATFNAAAFKKFAISLSQPLAKLNPKMFLVVFHPEYVGKSGVDCEVRRARWPMLQICYESDE